MCLPAARPAYNGSRNCHGMCPSLALRGEAIPTGRAGAHEIAPRAIRRFPRRRIDGTERLHLKGSRRHAGAHRPLHRNTSNPWKISSMPTERGVPGIIKCDLITESHSPLQRGKAGTLSREQSADTGRADTLDALGGHVRRRDGISGAVSASGNRGRDDVESR